MRSRLRSFLVTSALSFIPSLASATTISGIYVDGGSGYNEVQDQHVHANSPENGPAVQKFSVNHGTGFTGFGAVGYGFGNGLRVEAEGLYNFSHDNYTSSQYETGYTNNEKIATDDGKIAADYNPFYTKVNNTTQVPCTTKSQPIPGYTGAPLFDNTSKEYPDSTPQYLWSEWNTQHAPTYQIPADICWLINGNNNVQQFLDLNNGTYKQDGKSIHALPGTYSYTTGVQVSAPGLTVGSVPNYSSMGQAWGTSIWSNHPLYTYRRSL